MTKLQQLRDAQARMQDAKDMMNHFLETYDPSDTNAREDMLDLEIDVFFACKHLTSVERSQS